MPGCLPGPGVLSGDIGFRLSRPFIIRQVQLYTISLPSPPTSHRRSSDFCRIVEKLERSCDDQTRLTIEQVYPRICQLVGRASVCHKQIGGANNWSQAELSVFQDLILKYTRENILKINIYIKEPFAKKYIMVEYASMYEHHCQTWIGLTGPFQLYLDQQHWRSDGTLYWREHHHCHRDHLVSLHLNLELCRTEIQYHDQCDEL